MRSKKIDDDIMVACADTVFYPDAVNVWGILQYFLKKQSDLVACYHPADGEDVSARALVSVDTDDQHVTMFPSGAAPTSPGTADRVGAARLCPALYCFRRATLGRVHEYLDATPAGTERRTLEYFTHWLTEAPGAESSARAPERPAPVAAAVAQLGHAAESWLEGGPPRGEPRRDFNI